MTITRDSEMRCRRHLILRFFTIFALAGMLAACGRNRVEAVLETASLQVQEQDPSTEESGGSGDAVQAASLIQVYVCGAVQRPGVYELEEGERVAAAIRAAGGLLETADERALNQARVLKDGEQITVLTQEESSENRESGYSGGDTGSGRINLNRATKEELMTLTGIGEKKASDIIAYRDSHGSFTSVEEIRNVSGIGEKLFGQISEMLEV